MMTKQKFTKYPKEITEIRSQILDKMPKGALNADSTIMYGYFGVWIVIFACLAAIFKINIFPVQILISIALGFFWTLSLFYVHLFIHGHIFKNVYLQKIFALPSAYFAIISPTWWGYWHRLHHRFGTYEENVSGFQTINWVHIPAINNIFSKIKPEHNKISSFAYLFFWKPIAFSVNQFFYILHPRFPKYINRKIVILELSLILATHALVFYYLDWKLIVLIEIIPWLIQNFLSSLFVVTNHHPKLIAAKVTFQNTCSVVFKNSLFDNLFMNIGYHTEHHIFPECNPKYLPKLSIVLKENYPYQPILLSKALKIIFSKD